VDSAVVIAAHATHYATMMVLFGGFSFLVFIARPAYRDAGARDAGTWHELNRFCRAMAWWGIVGGLSLRRSCAIQSSAMSGCCG
jgi:uncharacterized membrane protein